MMFLSLLDNPELRLVFFIVFFMMLFSYSKNENFVIEDKIIEDESKIFIDLFFDNKIINLDLEEYIVGVVACEMPASFDEEALKAMSVAARTFALYKINKNNNYILNSDISDQCYISTEQMKLKWGNDFDKYYSKIVNVVNKTKHEYMTYNDEVILSFYFAISNGYTENVENVFSEKLDYLVSVDSSWDSKYDYKSEIVKYTLDEFYSKLNIIYSNYLNVEYDKSVTNRLNYIYINGYKFKGTEFRKLLSLKSTDVEIIRENDDIYIKTKGYGHGVGMSQYGANYMALNGYNYIDILKHYYTGIDIMNKI